MASFDHVVDPYDRARPGYPAGVFDAIEPLAGCRVLDGGAGTGIATRALEARGAVVTAVDIGAQLLTRARHHSPGLCAVVADGARLPFATGSFDLVCFAQAWHWLDPSTRCQEMHRVLVRGGRWSGWWSHARADAEDWFGRYWSEIESACVGAYRGQRDTDWGRAVGESGLFDVQPRITVAWRRRVDVETWMTDLSSHSYIAALPSPDRAQLRATLQSIIDGRFPDGTMDVPYETWLWTATATL